jgi:sarcosine oxidase subunit beta
MTKRSSALIHTHFVDETTARLVLASLRYFQNWKEVVGGNCGFTQTGLVVVAGTADAADLRDQVTRLQGIGASTRIVTCEELQELQPAARVDDIALATYQPEAGFADPMATTQLLAARAKALGVEFRTGTLVKNIRVERGRVVGIDTTTGTLEASAVVIAAGPWSDHLLRPLGVEIGIRAARMQVAFFDRPSELRRGHAAFLDATTGVYFRPHTFGLTLGGLSAPPAESVNPDRFDETIAREFVAEVQQHIAARLPAMAQARFVRGHAGVYDISPDARPVMSRVPGILGLVIAAGFGGTGFAIAPAIGACIAELVTDGEARTVDVRAWQFARFSEDM